MGESDKEFIEEEVTKIICDAIEKVYGLKVKHEHQDKTIVEVIISNPKEKELYTSIEYKHEKASEHCQQIIDNCLKGLLKLNKP